MGTSCSRDASGAVDVGASTAPAPPRLAATNRSTETSAGVNIGVQGNVSEDPTDAADGGGPSRSFLSRLRRSTPSGLSRQQERELREIEQLQFELAAMEALFQSMLGQAFREMSNGGNDPDGGGSGGGGPPPASPQAVRQLPSIRVSPEDLIEETNRECIICYVENHINDSVVRLPCGHLFHRECISQWLLKRCTCPVCRYEIPTADPHYERGRVERMRMRRPRMRRYELERMPARELRELAFTRLNLSDHFDLLTDKADLIDRIVNSGKVDIIESPTLDPWEYKISELRSMSIASLKHTMTDAGVIFDPLEIVEKEDMVSLILDSGRVSLLPEEGASIGNDKMPVLGGDGIIECGCSEASCQELSVQSDGSGNDSTCINAVGGVVDEKSVSSGSRSEHLRSGMKTPQARDTVIGATSPGAGHANRKGCASDEGSVSEKDCTTFTTVAATAGSITTRCAQDDSGSIDGAPFSSDM